MARKVLVVDDEPEMVEMMKVRLEKSGYKVTSSFSGEDCIKIAEIEHPDVILLDILLPGISGFEVCRRLKQNKTTKDIPVIMVTALVGEEAEAKGLDRGAKYFISKPFDPDKLLSEVRTAIEKGA